LQNEEKEELDFMFDEEMDEIEVGRKNTFTEWYVKHCVCGIRDSINI